MNLALLQISSTPISSGLPSPVTLLFNRTIGGLLTQMNKDPMIINNDEHQYEALKAHQDKYIKENDTSKDSLSFPVASTVAMQHEDGGP